ncbi:hypothetical protein BGZ61DRAFT_488219 [Ilyonectria robusta]|uniref:uncharacterized protein n=1 Tax=Ilyonectria robusta TaxID=1079257 RepID=UPI001E8D0610|nr:uncharacterized protein BGZ61DRAFT_488219 [Ilyonectria robusta]KAH8647003.1 hypothetical protein BGZ61DRAFT_488219 [Ilyonectria robusta]
MTASCAGGLVLLCLPTAACAGRLGLLSASEGIRSRPVITATCDRRVQRQLPMAAYAGRLELLYARQGICSRPVTSAAAFNGSFQWHLVTAACAGGLELLCTKQSVSQSVSQLIKKRERKVAAEGGLICKQGHLQPAYDVGSSLQQQLATAACNSSLQQQLATAACNSKLELLCAREGICNSSLCRQPRVAADKSGRSGSACQNSSLCRQARVDLQLAIACCAGRLELCAREGICSRPMTIAARNGGLQHPLGPAGSSCCVRGRVFAIAARNSSLQ